MIKCSKCGEFNSEDSKFCGVCGNSLIESNNSVNITSDNSNEIVSNQSLTNDSKKKYTVGAAIGKACAWFFGSIGVFILAMMLEMILKMMIMSSDPDQNLNPIVLSVFGIFQFIVPFVMAFVIAPIELIKGLIRAGK